jgi:hypothetical protein
LKKLLLVAAMVLSSAAFAQYAPMPSGAGSSMAAAGVDLSYGYGNSPQSAEYQLALATTHLLQDLVAEAEEGWTWLQQKAQALLDSGSTLTAGQNVSYMDIFDAPDSQIYELDLTLGHLALDLPQTGLSQNTAGQWGPPNPVAGIGSGESGTVDYWTDGNSFDNSPDATTVADDWQAMRSCAYSGMSYCVAPGDAPYPLSGDQGVADFYAYYTNSATAEAAKVDVANWQSAGSPTATTYMSYGPAYNVVIGGLTMTYCYQYSGSYGSGSHCDGQINAVQGAGTYTCNPGYTLGSDGQTCNLTNAKQYMTWLMGAVQPGFCHYLQDNSGNWYALPGDPGCSSTPTISPTPSGPNINVNAPNGQATNVNSGGTAGTNTVSNDTPNVNNNTTTTNTSTTAPKSGTVSNTTSNTYPGTGTGSTPTTGNTTSTPLTQTVTTGSGSGNSTVTVDFPASMAIANDGHTDNDATTIANAHGASDVSSYTAPLHSSLDPFGAFQLPGHTSTCPAWVYSFTLWKGAQQINLNNTAMCDFLTNNQTLIQSLLDVGYFASGILIVMGA